MMDIVDALTHALKSKVMRTTRAFTMNQFNAIQNSTRRLEGWHGDDFLH
jgi:hypothetical protein